MREKNDSLKHKTWMFFIVNVTSDTYNIKVIINIKSMLYYYLCLYILCLIKCLIIELRHPSLIGNSAQYLALTQISS